LGEDLQIADWRVEPRLNIVSRNGRATRLEPKVMAVLVCLAQHAGELVSKEELLQTVWPDTFVTEDVLKRSVFELRRVLEDDARQPRIIQTIPKSGYRLLVAAETIDRSGDVAVLANEAPRASRRWRSLALIAGLAALLILVAVGGYRLRGGLGKKSDPSQIRSIAVLPLENLSRDPAQEYLSDGLTDALITDLAQIGSLRVVSRTSSSQYKQSTKSLPEIGRELGVEGIVEGTIQKSGGRVRITAQLIHAPSDKHLWANAYERDMRDVFALERDLAQQIADRVQGRIAKPSHAPLHPSGPANNKALEAYLQGNYHLTRAEWSVAEDEKRAAAQYFQLAIDADPNFAPAYIGLAKAHSELALGSSEDIAIVKRAAEKALALDPNSAEAWDILGLIKWKQLDWDGAEQDERRSKALSPQGAACVCTLGLFLAATGRLDEGLREAEIDQDLNPNEDLSLVLEMRGEHDLAIELLQRAVALHPTDSGNHYNLFRNYAETRKYKQAVQELENALTLMGTPEIAADVRRGFVASGYRGAMREYATALEAAQVAQEGFFPESLAIAYTAVGDKDRAFHWLEQAYEHRESVGLDWGLMIIREDHMLDALHSDPRFKDLLRRIGLPE
jgi:TolB-like protein/DNA-binding winged helix-turn-helix (wHTH) protein/Flp pilus assembly protein TadD